MLGRAGGHRDRRHGVGFDYLHVAVDDCSRLAYVEIHPNERRHTAAGFTGRALAWFAGLGVHVEQVMTDNGPAIAPMPSGRSWPPLGSGTDARARIGPAPTARPSASTRP